MTSSNNKPENETFPYISVIIVNYNGLRFLQNCFASLKNQSYPSSRYEVILVDNGSTDGSIEFIHEQIVAARDAGKTVVIISTELDEVLALADRIAVMYRGRIVGIVDAKATREKLGKMMAGIAA